MLMPQSDEGSARQLAERLRQSVEELEFVGFKELRGTITCGVAIADRADEKPSQILVRADQAMYLGKAQGRNQVVVFRSSEQDTD